MNTQQIRRAYALALAHGHLWASCIARHTDDGGALPETWETVEEVYRRLADDVGGEWGGIGPSHAHTTGSGRLRWSVEEDGTVTLSVRSPGEKLSAARALRRAAEDASTAFAPAERRAWDAYRSSVGPEQATHAACLLILSQAEALAAQLADGVEMIGATIHRDGRVEIRPSLEYRPVASGGSIQGPAMRHWLCLRDALSALDARPEWPEDVARAFAAYDEAWAPVRAAEASRSALLDLPEAEREAPAWQARYEAASAAVRGEEETCAPLRQDIYQSEVRSGYQGPAVEMVRRRRLASEGE